MSRRPSKHRDGNLYLTRREGESIVVDGPCRFTVVEIHRSYIRIAVCAPASTNIARQEVLPDDQQNLRAVDLCLLPSMPPDIA